MLCHSSIDGPPQSPAIPSLFRRKYQYSREFSASLCLFLNQRENSTLQVTRNAYGNSWSVARIIDSFETIYVTKSLTAFGFT